MASCHLVRGREPEDDLLLLVAGTGGGVVVELLLQAGVVGPVVGLDVLALLSVVLQPFKIEMHAWVLRRRGVPRKQVAEWALAQSKKERVNRSLRSFAPWRR